MRAVTSAMFFILISGLLGSAIAGDYSPLYAYRHREAVASMDQNPITVVAMGTTDRVLIEEDPHGVASALFTISSFCMGSACLGSACMGSLCLGSGCFGSACLGSGCAAASVCVGSACGGSACLGSVCVGSGCLGSVCGSYTACDCSFPPIPDDPIGSSMAGNPWHCPVP